MDSLDRDSALRARAPRHTPTQFVKEAVDTRDIPSTRLIEESLFNAAELERIV